MRDHSSLNRIAFTAETPSLPRKFAESKLSCDVRWRSYTAKAIGSVFGFSPPAQAAGQRTSTVTITLGGSLFS
jgi:hypothetical protein